MRPRGEQHRTERIGWLRAVVLGIIEGIADAVARFTKERPLI
jgi:VIT1/CCC1 family predicted Fe2+/Mn2+ transporter